MITNDRKAFRRAALNLGSLFLFLLVVLVFTGLAAHQNLLLTLLLLLLVLFSFGFSLLRSQRVYGNRRRLRALQRDHSLLAAWQPVPDENALSLPTTLQLRPRRRYFLAMAGIVAIIVAIIPYLNVSPFSLTLPALAIRLAIALVTFLLCATIMPPISRPRLQYDLELNEHGLSVTYNQVRTAVNWREARLFAVNDPKNPRRPKVYELASSDTVARWMWLPPRLPFFSVYQPTLPLEEYQQQMQAVLQLIEAKTHLPLYDIGPPNDREPVYPRSSISRKSCEPL